MNCTRGSGSTLLGGEHVRMLDQRFERYPVLPSHIILLPKDNGEADINNIFFLFESEQERGRERERKRDRERQRENLKQVSCSAWSPTWGSIP